jgi:hypothetical protein
MIGVIFRSSLFLCLEKTPILRERLIAGEGSKKLEGLRVSAELMVYINLTRGSMVYCSYLGTERGVITRREVVLYLNY